MDCLSRTLACAWAGRGSVLDGYGAVGRGRETARLRAIGRAVGSCKTVPGERCRAGVGGRGLRLRLYQRAGGRADI